MKTNKIKQITTLSLFVLLFFPLAVWAQEGDDRHEQHQERIEAQRIAYITSKLELTPAEAEKFWPVYNQHHKQMEKMANAFHEDTEKDGKELSAMTEDEAQKILETRLKQEDEMYNARKKYLLSLKDVLPTAKILALLDAEKGFKMDLMRSASKRGERDSPQRGGGLDH